MKPFTEKIWKIVHLWPTQQGGPEGRRWNPTQAWNLTILPLQNVNNSPVRRDRSFQFLTSSLVNWYPPSFVLSTFWPISELLRCRTLNSSLIYTLMPPPHICYLVLDLEHWPPLSFLPQLLNLSLSEVTLLRKGNNKYEFGSGS